MFKELLMMISDDNEHEQALARLEKLIIADKLHTAKEMDDLARDIELYEAKQQAAQENK